MKIIGSISPAWQRMTSMLFRPFSLGKWFALGFVFFLQSLIEGGGGNRLNNDFGGGGSGSSGGGAGGGHPPSFVETLQLARKFVVEHSGSLTILIVTGAVVGLVALVAFSWLGTRGQMMAIRNVSRGEASVGEAWRETGDAGFALFKLRLVLSAIGLVVTLPLIVLAISRTYALIDDGVTDAEPLLVGLLPFVVVLVATGFVFGAFDAVVRNFVAPLMWRFELGVGEGFARFRELAEGRWLSIVLFLGARFVAMLGVGLVDTLLVTCTCCIGGLPVLHQTLMAPWHVFERAWTLEFIESAGPEWTMLDPIAAAPVGYPPAPPPGYGGYPSFPGQ